ncbi:MAG: methionine--tRNA ligase [Parcubacteria group bacterium CG2_30_44_11]|nr:MAG: methionine--tRNA ligase [Parcubacteria group bacterium CG2_30_44_11]
MSDKLAKYITTTLPYVNDKPHIGHALEFVQADTLARYWRLIGHDVFFNTGTDEHGQKIAQKADVLGEDRQAYVDRFALKFNELKVALNLSYDAFIRTTDAKHKTAAAEIWRRCAEKGDIYKKKYTGLYCVGCELFYKESELGANKCCLIHQKPVEEVEEENYFFRLSNYQERLAELLRDPARTLPNWQREWALTFVEGGLDDLSISRQRSRMDWGIPVPGDDDHVMYVWFDALTNYISTLGWPDESGDFKKFWLNGDTMQMAGKDQVRFQSIIFQAMLMSADMPTTDIVVYHGFINSGGQKMSKSLGNTIDPSDLVKRYGTDATRYIFLRHVHPTEDSDLTWEKMDEYYTANLVNGLGNLTARIMKMCEQYLEPEDYPLLDPTTLDAPNILNFQAAMDHIWGLIQHCDEVITETEPFKLIKTEPEQAKAILSNLRADLLHIGRLLLPCMPETSVIIRAAVRANKKPDNLFARLEV